MCQKQLSPQQRSASTPSSRSSRRPSGSSGHTGDSKQRVTVPMPRSIHELQNRAVRLFGHGGELNMYHHGTALIQDPSHLGHIQDGDVVVVTWNDRRLTPKEFAALTTNQSDFVEHPLPNKAPAPKSPTKLPPVVPFDAVTSYKSEYVRHPLSKRDVLAKPPHMWVPPKGATGKSTYEEQFPWRDPAPENRSQPPSRETDRRKSEPFTGCTSYMHDYLAPPPKPRAERSVAPRPRPANIVPFQGKTTYEAEFTEKPLSAPRPQQPKLSTLEDLPFEGSSEYQNEYMRKRVSQPMIHLEPELD
jgi:hypothetical protein